jgi:hypothetical protein
VQLKADVSLDISFKPTFSFNETDREEFLYVYLFPTEAAASFRQACPITPFLDLWNTTTFEINTACAEKTDVTAISVVVFVSRSFVSLPTLVCPPVLSIAADDACRMTLCSIQRLCSDTAKDSAAG